jgi:hypothetical protein
MSQFPHDRFNKNLFELRLSPFGEVSIQRSLDPETTFIDIYFVPQQPIALEPQLSLLAECISGQAVAFVRLCRPGGNTVSQSGRNQ